MEIYRIASERSDIAELKDAIRSIKSDIRDLKKDSKDYDSKIKKIEKAIDDLNVGNRRFWQERTVFTSLQRKLERLEVLEQQWKKFKEEIPEDIERKIDKHTRARIGELSPPK